MITAVYRRFKDALKHWNLIRKELLEEFKKMEERNSSDHFWQKYIDNLRETDPKKLDNYPLDEPFLEEWEVYETFGKGHTRYK